MARRRSSSIAVWRPPAPRAATPIIRIATPRAPAAPRRHHKRRSGGGRGAGSGSGSGSGSGYGYGSGDGDGSGSGSGSG